MQKPNDRARWICKEFRIRNDRAGWIRNVCSTANLLYNLCSFIHGINWPFMTFRPPRSHEEASTNHSESHSLAICNAGRNLDMHRVTRELTLPGMAGDFETDVQHKWYFDESAPNGYSRHTHQSSLYLGLLTICYFLHPRFTPSNSCMIVAVQTHITGQI